MARRWPLAQWLQQEVAPEFQVFQFIRHFKEAFGIPLAKLRLKLASGRRGARFIAVRPVVRTCSRRDLRRVGLTAAVRYSYVPWLP